MLEMFNILCRLQSAWNRIATIVAVTVEASTEHKKYYRPRENSQKPCFENFTLKK
jgi:hypothetical protein